MLVDAIPDFQTDNGSVDYAAIGKAVGIDAVGIGRPADGRAGLTEALSRPGPALIDLVTDTSALSIPPHITVEEVTGFALATGKVARRRHRRDSRARAVELTQHPAVVTALTWPVARRHDWS